MSLGDTATLVTIRHDWDAPVERIRSYPSRVIPKRDGSEQRPSLSGTPTDGLTYRLLAPSSFDATQLQALPTLAADALLRMPRWEDEARVGSAVSAGSAVVIACVTSDRPTFVVGAQVLLWRSATSYEVATMTAVSSSSITADLVSGWAAGTIVVPITPCRLTLPVDLTNWAPTSGALTLHVTASLFDIAGVGTGGSASTATPFAIAVSNTLVPLFGRAPITAVVTDSAGDPITTDAIVWTSSDPTNVPVWPTPDSRVAIVEDLNGVLVAETITATLGALSDSAFASAL